MKTKTVTGFDYLWCALYACAAFAIELLVVMVEKKLGYDTEIFTVSQNIVHWVVITFLWVAAGYLVIVIGKKTTDYDIWETKSKLQKWQYIALAVCFVVNIIAKYIDWEGFKVIHEWNSRGPLLFVFQYIYYIAEGFLISLVIVFGQIACEKLFKNEKIPYGGIILGLTWGIAHIYTKGIAVGILSAVAGFLFGTAYMFVNRDYRKALPIITLLFIL